MDDFNFDSLDLGSRTWSPPVYIATAPPLVSREKSQSQSRYNNGHGSSSRRAEAKEKAAGGKAASASLHLLESSQSSSCSDGEVSASVSSAPAAERASAAAESKPGLKVKATPVAKKPHTAETLQARAEEAMKRSAGAAHLEWLEPESDEGNVEYKLRLKDPSTMRFQQLVTQMKFRLSEGNGECFYYLGVEDDGFPRGLTEADLEQSLTTLRAMAAEVHATAAQVRALPGSSGRACAVLRVHRICRDEVSYVDLRIAVAGAVESGKSTLVAILTNGARGRPILDNGRGSARMAVFRHKHEIESGRTSSISQQMVGYDEDGRVLNYSGVAPLTPAEIATSARKVLRFIDIGGHEKYLKTALYGMTSLLPDYVLLCVNTHAHGHSLPRASREHLAVALALEIPLAVVLTQVDVAAPSGSSAAIQQIRAVLSVAVAGAGAADGLPSKQHAHVAMPLVASEAQASALAHEVAGNRMGAARSMDAPLGLQRHLTVPLFATSAVTGSGIPLLHAFLASLRSTAQQPTSALDGDDANGSSQSQLVADCPPGEASASEASASDAYSMFALSLDNDSCRSPEVLGATPPATERPKRNLYMPEQRPLVHFQVDQTFDVRGVGSVLSGTVLSGQISLGQQLWLGPAESGSFSAVSVTGIQREQLPVKMVRCWQHATLAVQLASSAASSGPAWARKSSSFVAAPPIAEEDSGAEASSQSASPSPPVPLAAGALNGTGSAVAAAVSSRKEAALAAQPSHVGQRSAHGAAVLPQAASASDEGQPASLPWQNGADVPLGNGIALNDAAGAQGVTRADSNDRGAQPQQALSGSHGAAPTHAGDVFREPQPCGGSAGGSLPPTSRGLSAAAQPAAVQPGGNETSARESRYIEGRVAGSCVKLAQLHPAGSMAAQQRILADSAAGGTGSVETFGVGRSALEAVAPDNFGGMSIEWTAEGGRWVVRSNSAPALFPNAAPPAKKGTVLLDMAMQPRAVWRFEAVLVLLSGHWPPRGLVSGCWPPGAPGPELVSSSLGSAPGWPGEASSEQSSSWPGRQRPRTAYTPVVHCGSVRQAAHVIQMTEMRSASGSAVTQEHGVSLAPAVAAAAALLCTSASGEGKQVMHIGDPHAADREVRQIDSPTSSADETDIVAPPPAHWSKPGNMEADDLTSLSNFMDEGCIATVIFEFLQHPEWLQEGARLIVHDRTDNCLSGAGFVRRLFWQP